MSQPTQPPQPSPALDALDQAFLRFQDTGNPDDLAEVFDGTAPRLLQMARHLSPEYCAADDLLQATFLTAIEHRDKFVQRKGRVLSWLFAIMANEARVRRRAAGHLPGLGMGMGMGIGSGAGMGPGSRSGSGSGSRTG